VLKLKIKLGSPAMVITDEWIGMEVEVVESSNPCEIGIKGVVVDETMRTLRIKTDRGVKVVEKKGRAFKVKYGRWLLKVRGDLIAFRPEDRIKKGIMLIKKSKLAKIDV